MDQMEHRWGRRVDLKIPVRLIAEFCDPIIGQTQNVSISGTFLHTARSVSIGTRLVLEVILPGQLGRQPQRVTAYVVRRTRDGVAIEWCEFAPHAMRTLLLAADSLAAHPAHLEASRGAERPGAQAAPVRLDRALRNLGD